MIGVMRAPDLDGAFEAEIARRSGIQVEHRAKLEAADREAILDRARGSLINFTTHTNPRYMTGWFNEHLGAELDQFLVDVTLKKSPRLMIFAPPRHGKSELVSRRFPAYGLGRFPDLQFIATSYAADLAGRMNRDVQRIIDTPIYGELFPQTGLFGKNIRTVASGSWLRNSDAFEVVDHRGSYRSAGVGGGITGMGADIGIIDDPFKDMKEANSPTIRESVWEWYTSTFYTRIEAGGGILIVLTRWHEDDLAGRLLKQQADGDGDDWRIVKFPAIAEAGYVDENDPRDVGEPLHPARYDTKRLMKIKKAVGSYVWTSLYQQSPTNREGTLFKPDMIEVVKPESLPPMEKIVRGWDLAGSRKKASSKAKGGPDFTAGVLIGKGRDGMFYIMDAKHIQERPAQVRATVKATASQDGLGIYIRMPQDPGQAGVDQKDQYVQALAGYMVKFAPVSGDKETRATPLASQVDGGNVRMVAAPWNKPLLDEMRSFPNGAHDDLIDAAADAFNEIAGIVPGEGLLEYYRQEAEKAALQALGGEVRAGNEGLVGYYPPEATQLAFGAGGHAYRPDAEGIMWLRPEDAPLLARRGGWTVVEQNDEGA